jgi:predicted TIM-barrel fold metal-dependent hydrolase
MTIKERAELGQALTDLEIIDSHAHLGALSGFFHCDPSPERMIREMFLLGIDQTAISPHMSLKYSASQGNALMHQTVTKYPQRFLGYITVNPQYPDESRQDLEKYWGQKNIVGVKIHPGMHNCHVADAKYVPLWEFAQQHRVPVLSHTWSGTNCAPALFGPLAGKYPAITFILGHMGGTCQGVREAIRMSQEHANIHLEMCGWEFSETWLEDIIRLAGADKILFGTDSPWHNPAFSFGRLVYARIPDADKEKILAQNFKKIISGK